MNSNYLEGFKTSRAIYDRLQDQISKDIFENRLQYSITGNHEYIRRIIHSDPYLKSMVLPLETAENIIIYGRGGVVTWSWVVNHLCLKYKLKCYIENNIYSQTTYDQSVPSITFDDFTQSGYNKLDNTLFILATIDNNFINEMFFDLISIGVKRENIYETPRVFSGFWKNMYFDIFKPVHNEVFVDIGSFDGGTSLTFCKWCRGDFSKILLFEPDAKNMPLVKKNMQHLENCEFFDLGAWDKTETLKFNHNGSGSYVDNSKTQSAHITEIKAVALDDVIGNERVTFIKMDIEGSELKALKGAENIIRAQNPKLAISIYHKPEDILELPHYLLSINPNYKFWLRHHSIWEYETVLYAQV